MPKRLLLLAITAVLFFTVARAQELHRRPTEEERIQKLEDQIASLGRMVHALCTDARSIGVKEICIQNFK